MRIFLVLIFFTSIISCAKAEPPNFVWRTDTRDYNEIFQNGFKSWGGNNNIYEHLSGVSCFSYQDEHDSAFISTTASHEAAVDFADVELSEAYSKKAGKSAVVYIYKIRATNNFYDGVTSLENYANIFPDTKKYQIYKGIMSKTEVYEEWLAVNKIERSLIVEAYPAYLENGILIVGPGYKNPFYIEESTKGSTSPYNKAIRKSNKNDLTWVTSVKPLIGVCSALHVGNILMNKAYPYELTTMFFFL
ncbi:scabin-related ADP-ribosyltransferase [Pantoea ananatis]|uniref:scabin-related ADP-ribosyltransferase n=1 Tax=Pantoea ananas TaxID=553 RepID=UPI00234FEE82|nr:hypothetical protein [Pantoea ananatis]MDC7862235.1 hypothetical protein [Pantoea ananatis]